MTTPISPPPVSELNGDRLPAYVSNGVIGLRVPALPWFGGLAVVNGLVGLHPIKAIECVPQVPYPLNADLRVDGLWLSGGLQRGRAIDQSYDFATGELTSRFAFDAGDVTATVSVVTFASRTEPTVVLQESVIELDRPADVEVRAIVAPDDIAGEIGRREQGVPGSNSELVDGTMRWCPSGDFSAAGIAYATQFVGTRDHDRAFGEERVGPLHTTYRFRARAGRRYRLRQYASLVPDGVHHDPDRQATRLVALAARHGFEQLREANRMAWAELWKSRIVLVGGDETWQALTDAAFFYLHTSVHSSSLCSTNIFGLAQWKDYHYYYGHVMWDIEAFAVPPLLLAQPHAARAILDYRRRGLEAARRNAQQWGYRGAQYPWQASPVRGEEAAPELGDAAMYEHHVSMSVAHAFAEYSRATADARYLAEHAWPVQAEVAEWITSRVERSDRGYELRRVMGIAERGQPCDNSAYVNMAAAVALADTIETAGRLGRPVPAAWEAIRDGLVLPMRGDVILDHDGYHPGVEKGATPAALCGLFPFGYRTSRPVFEATVKFYLEMADDYIGSPMLSALYGAWAAQVGDRTASARLFEEGYAKFVSPRFLNTHEYRSDRFPDEPVAGPFTANIGGFLTALLYGLTGIRLGFDDPTTWGREPVVMPEGWDGIEVERVWAHGRPASIVAKHGDPRALIEFTD